MLTISVVEPLLLLLPHTWNDIEGEAVSKPEVVGARSMKVFFATFEV